MRQLCNAILAALTLAACLAASHAADCSCGRRSCTSCTDDAACQPCVPACKSSWDEKKTKKTKYSMKCEYACARDAECFCTGPAECRCSPPCGRIYTKKKFYKEDGEETVERVPKYEITMTPAEPCDCARCSGVCWLNPLSILHYLIEH